jgi:hypothetical protein
MARVQGMQYFSAHYIGAVSCTLFASAGMGGPYKSGCLFLRILAMAISFLKHAKVWRYESSRGELYHKYRGLGNRMTPPMLLAIGMQVSGKKHRYTM